MPKSFSLVSNPCVMTMPVRVTLLLHRPTLSKQFKTVTLSITTLSVQFVRYVYGWIFILEDLFPLLFFCSMSLTYVLESIISLNSLYLEHLRFELLTSTELKKVVWLLESKQYLYGVSKWSLDWSLPVWACQRFAVSSLFNCAESDIQVLYWEIMIMLHSTSHIEFVQAIWVIFPVSQNNDCLFLSFEKTSASIDSSKLDLSELYAVWFVFYFKYSL